MPTDLTGKVALVTGASQGIGRAIALDLAKHGATVALAARSLDKLESLAAEITSAGGTAKPSPSTSPPRTPSSPAPKPSSPTSAPATSSSTTPASPATASPSA